ncbi:MAG: secondary thiamine-phosphate synthase enzyme YjbQ [Thermodesulfobacteriota bacterium]|nr:secondary thiamine-phosphate synthase enzyme YjbQ [Thermodesulfobacteriota bacterium]
MVTLSVKTGKRREMRDITADLENAVADAGLQNGVVMAYVPHTTAGITINENADPDVQTDILAHLEKLVPHSAGFRHMEGNSDAHIQASLMGSSITVIVENGSLVLGTWQSAFFCEFDGPRNRKLHVQLIPG